MPTKPFIRKFEDGEPYTQPCGPNCQAQRDRRRVERGPGSHAGPHVERAGCARHKAPDNHRPVRHRHQVIGDEEIAISGPTVIRIPDHTTHTMKLAGGEEMVTLYVNEFVD